MKTKSLKNILFTTLSPLCIWSLSSGQMLAVVYAEPIEWTMVYNTTLMPHEAGSVNYSNGTSSSFEKYSTNNTNTIDTSTAISRLGLSVVDNEYLGFNTNNIAFAMMSSGQVDQLFLNKDIGYTVEYKVRVLGAYIAEDAIANNPGGGQLDMDDGRAGTGGFWQFGFGADIGDPSKTFVMLRGSDSSPLVYIDDRWITYTILVKDDTATYYMDGVLMYSVTLRNLDTNIIRWGNMAGANYGVEMEVAHLKIYDKGAIIPIPEPSMYAVVCGLLSLGAVGLHLTSRRRRA